MTSATSSSERYTGSLDARRIPEWSYCMYMDPETFETCNAPDPRVFIRIEVPLVMLRCLWLTDKTAQRISSPAAHPAERGCFIGLDVTLCDKHRGSMQSLDDRTWFEIAAGVDVVPLVDETDEPEIIAPRPRRHREYRPRIDPVPSGTRFGRLVLLEDVDRTTVNVRLRCDCGNEITRRFGIIRTGNTKSCGCLRDEWLHRKRDDHPWKTRP